MRARAFDTDAFYRASCDAGYVKLDAMARNACWTSATTWGDLEITINLSKPEKDPRDIAAAARAPKPQDATYIDPATGAARPCPLCVTEADVECGYAHPIRIGGERWALWYSPYAYFDHHCIAMSWQHRPMHIDRAAFACLFDVVDQFPQYFFGSNADLPIVGGSILGHDHFQGGRHVFPMQTAPIAERFEMRAHPGVEAGIVKWPMSVIRLQGGSRDALVDAATAVLEAWCRYDDPSVGIVSGMSTNGEVANAIHDARGASDASAAHSTGDAGATGTTHSAGDAGTTHAAHDASTTLQPGSSPGAHGVRKVHNTITPILCRTGNGYQFDLALRCNITSAEHPLGVFHPHEDLHHVKKENIGLIEVMGRAILPPRVLRVMEDRGLSPDDVGGLFARVLEDAGVFKWDEAGRRAFRRFIRCLCNGA